MTYNVCATSPVLSEVLRTASNRDNADPVCTQQRAVEDDQRRPCRDRDGLVPPERADGQDTQ